MINYLLISSAILFIILWPNTIKLAKATRPEYFYWDFLIAVFCLSLATSYTLGFSSAFSFPSFSESFTHLFRFAIRALMGGLIVNLAYFLFVTTGFLVGITYTVVVNFSLAMATGTMISILLNPHNFPASLLLAMLFFLLTTLFFNISCKKNTDKTYRSKKAITFCTISGILFGLFFPLLRKSFTLSDPSRLEPHIAFFFFICGLIISYFFLSLLLKNKPLISPPFTFKGFFQISLKNHLYGFMGGILWGGTVLCRIFSHVDQIYTYAFVISHIYPLITACIGIFYWREYENHPKTYKYLVLGFLCFSVGVFFLSFNDWTIP